MSYMKAIDCVYFIQINQPKLVNYVFKFVDKQLHDHLFMIYHWYGSITFRQFVYDNNFKFILTMDKNFYE